MTQNLLIPTLEETAKRYLKSVEPFVSKEELERTKQVVEEFIKPSGEGERLQQRLIDRSVSIWNHEPKKNWLEDWWLRYAYLAWPDPIVINSNWYMLLHPDVVKSGTDQAFQAARLATSFASFKRFLEAGKLPQEYMTDNDKKIPLCMNQYNNIFTTSRIPGFDGDTLFRVEPREEIVVISKRQFYVVQLPEANSPTGIYDLYEQFNWILQDSSNHEAEHRYGVGALTSEVRPTWAKWRKVLEADENNSQILDTIDRCTFVLSLDSNEVHGYDDAAYACIGGDANDRWYDKNFQLIVFKNGRGGLNGEHSPADAPALGVMTEYAMAWLSKYPEQPDNKSRSSGVVPRKLKWNLSKELHNAIVEANVHYQSAFADLDHTILLFDDFGTDYVKSKLKCSPDSLMQMAIQLAFYRLHKQPCATYETAQTRQYYHGRTEACRSCSSESLAFAQCMLSDASNKVKLDSFLTALAAHKNYMKAATFGKGVDRHLLGLKLLALEESKDDPNWKMPRIFTDPAFARSNTWRLSTSNVPSKYYLGGFGSVCMDGYGVCYQLWANTLVFNISCRRQCFFTSAAAMKGAIIQSLRDIAALYTTNSPKL